jgi:hypothetical protein
MATKTINIKTICSNAGKINNKLIIQSQGVTMPATDLSNIAIPASLKGVMPKPDSDTLITVFHLPDGRAERLQAVANKWKDSTSNLIDATEALKATAPQEILNLYKI